MKLPHEISSDFFKKMISSGWYAERDVLLKKLPPHLEELPKKIKKFLREIWYISITVDDYWVGRHERYVFRNYIYTFGETTHALIDYSSEEESSWLSPALVKRKLRHFGYKHGREILIDAHGAIYEIPDSGDVYYLGGKFYEGLYNLIYNRGTSYIVDETGALFTETAAGIKPANAHIDDIA